MENKSADYNFENLSQSYKIYNTSNPDFLSYIEALCSGSKAMLSESLWIFLINDTNNFLRQQYDNLGWNKNDSKKYIDLLNKRTEILKSKGVYYYQFIIPEKSVIYPEYLPKIFHGKKTNNSRAVLTIYKALPNVYYLEEYLKNLKSFGLLYFRGDTHTNWLGSYFVYHYIINKLRSNNYAISAIPIKNLKKQSAEYNGDLYVQLNNDYYDLLKKRAWPVFNNKSYSEYLIRYSLADNNKSSYKVNVPQDYKEWFNNRETIIYENKNKDLPRCVVLRDSTCSFILDYLAEHFSRTVFIWHNSNIYSEIIEREKADIVLHIMAERFLITQNKKKDPFDNIENLKKS